jgi:hypothetical protein
MASILDFGVIPAPRFHDAHHRLPAGMNVNVLHRHLLLALAAVAIEGFKQRGEGAAELVRLVKVLAPALESLLVNHGAPVALHRRIVGGDQLRRHHAFQLVLRTDAGERRDGGAQLLVSRFRTRVLCEVTEKAKALCDEHEEKARNAQHAAADAVGAHKSALEGVQKAKAEQARVERMIAEMKARF